MPCQGCPDFTPSRDDSRPIAVIVYTGGPEYALFANVIRVLAPDKEGVVTKWSCPSVYPAGELQYKQNEAEPPSIEGYQRDTSNPWLLRPIWPPCAWRMLRVWREDTGAVSISAGCLCPASNTQPYESLALSQCQNCAQRRF